MFKFISKARKKCPLTKQKCSHNLCEFYMEFKNRNNKTGKTTVYGRCAYVQIPFLMIETRETIELLIKLLIKRKK